MEKKKDGGEGVEEATRIINNKESSEAYFSARKGVVRGWDQ